MGGNLGASVKDLLKVQPCPFLFLPSLVTSAEALLGVSSSSDGRSKESSNDQPGHSCTKDTFCSPSRAKEL